MTCLRHHFFIKPLCKGTTRLRSKKECTVLKLLCRHCIFSCLMLWKGIPQHIGRMDEESSQKNEANTSKPAKSTCQLLKPDESRTKKNFLLVIQQTYIAHTFLTFLPIISSLTPTLFFPHTGYFITSDITCSNQSTRSRDVPLLAMLGITRLQIKYFQLSPSHWNAILVESVSNLHTVPSLYNSSESLKMQLCQHNFELSSHRVGLGPQLSVTQDSKEAFKVCSNCVK